MFPKSELFWEMVGELRYRVKEQLSRFDNPTDCWVNWKFLNGYRIGFERAFELGRK